MKNYLRYAIYDEVSGRTAYASNKRDAIEIAKEFENTYHNAVTVENTVNNGIVYETRRN